MIRLLTWAWRHKVITALGILAIFAASTLGGYLGVLLTTSEDTKIVRVAVLVAPRDHPKRTEATLHVYTDSEGIITATGESFTIEAGRHRFSRGDMGCAYEIRVDSDGLVKYDADGMIIATLANSKYNAHSCKILRV